MTNPFEYSLDGGVTWHECDTGTFLVDGGAQSVMIRGWGPVQGAASSASGVKGAAAENRHFTPMESRGTLVYLGRSGGFDVRDCPEPEHLAAFIAAACNAYALADRSPAVQQVAGQAVRLAKKQQADPKLAGPGATARERFLLAQLEWLQSAVLATPAPEQEAAFKNDLGWGKCQVLKSEAAQVAPPGAQEVQDIMFEVFEYAKLSEGIDKAEGEARAYQRDAMLQQDRKIRNMISALTAPVPATTPAEQPQGDVMRGKSGASSTAFDDQYAEDPTGAANTNKGGE